VAVLRAMPPLRRVRTLPHPRPVRDLALDSDGDLELSAGRARLTTEEDGESVAQRLRVRLRLWRGDYALDTRVGIPFRRWLGSKGEASVTLAETVLRRAVATCPGVGRVDSFAFALDRATRIASVDFAVTTDTGIALSDNVFLEGA
jgi:hypothetical protein